MAPRKIQFMKAPPGPELTAKKGSLPAPLQRSDVASALRGGSSILDRRRHLRIVRPAAGAARQRVDPELPELVVAETELRLQVRGDAEPHLFAAPLEVLALADG